MWSSKSSGVLALLLLGCSPVAPPAPKPTLSPLDRAVTTLERTFTPVTPRQRGTGNPSQPAVLARAVTDGWAELATGPGEPFTTRTFDGAPAPSPGPNARRLTRVVHLADLQLLDDESPMRITSLDARGFAAGAARPQDAQACRLANAAVRTINGLHRAEPIDLVLLGGDNLDSAQSNELQWLLDTLGGGAPVECDSGDDDDPAPGAPDGKDRFLSEGLAMPYRWVNGNHDVLVQGLFAVTPERVAAALRTEASGGTRDGRGALLTEGTRIPADDRRALLTPKALLERVAADRDGHGVDARQLARGKAFSSFDVPGTPLTFLVLDTTAETGGDDAIVRRGDFDTFIQPVLDRAVAERRVLVLVAHHATDRLTTTGGPLGTAQADALDPAEVLRRLGANGRVAFSLVGHAHTNRVIPITTPSGGWWELTTSAIIDFPNQLRVVEVFDQDNGWWMLRATVVDLTLDGDEVAAQGRRASIVDFTSGWLAGERLVGGEAADRNVELWIRKAD